MSDLTFATDQALTLPFATRTVIFRDQFTPKRLFFEQVFAQGKSP
jgi:hypothetical protein